MSVTWTERERKSESERGRGVEAICTTSVFYGHVEAVKVLNFFLYQVKIIERTENKRKKVSKE